MAMKKSARERVGVTVKIRILDNLAEEPAAQSRQQALELEIVNGSCLQQRQ